MSRAVGLISPAWTMVVHFFFALTLAAGCVTAEEQDDSARGEASAVENSLEGSQTATWSYEGETGPSHWASLSRENWPCRLGERRGERQSPLDLPRADHLPFAGQRLSIDYKSVSGQSIHNGLELGADFPPTSGASISLNGRRFALSSLRLHRPAEHLLDAVEFPLEIQLYHDDGRHEIAALAVFVDAGGSGASPADDALLAVANRQLHALDPSALLPSRRAHYVYSGSLTTPPCTENTTWLVFAEPLTVSLATLKAVAAALPRPNARRHPEAPAPNLPLRTRTHGVSYEDR